MDANQRIKNSQKGVSLVFFVGYVVYPCHFFYFLDSSPVFIDRNTDLNVVARRLSWGKFLNAGQTCVAPDYVMCPKEVQVHELAFFLTTCPFENF